MYIYIAIGDNQPTVYRTEETAKNKASGDFVYKLNLATLEIKRVDDKW